MLVYLRCCVDSIEMEHKRSIFEYQTRYILVWAVDHLADHLSSDIALAGDVNRSFCGFQIDFFTLTYQLSMSPLVGRDEHC